MSSNKLLEVYITLNKKRYKSYSMTKKCRMSRALCFDFHIRFSLLYASLVDIDKSYNEWMSKNK